MRKRYFECTRVGFAAVDIKPVLAGFPAQAPPAAAPRP
jgi:hypothetical protein